MVSQLTCSSFGCADARVADAGKLRPTNQALLVDGAESPIVICLLSRSTFIKRATCSCLGGYT
jgi:hypothetical protein